MTISALIPTYNRREHVCRAIDSVLSQTVPVKEIIVVDDGSTDGTAEAIRSRYGSRVSVFRQENAGVSAARNRGLLEARGEWIAFLDSDDVWFPEKIERQIEAVSTFGKSDFGACFTNCVFAGNTEMGFTAFEHAGLKTQFNFGALEAPPKYVLAKCPAIYVQSLMVRRSLVEVLCGFDESMIVSEDTDLLFRLGLQTKFCFVAEPLVKIDRTPFREVGLCELYGTKNDRVYDSLERMYLKWLTLPPALTGDHRPAIRQMLLSIRYEYAITKAYKFKLSGAIRKLHDAKVMEGSYSAVIVHLLNRGIKKMGRIARRKHSV